MTVSERSRPRSSDPLDEAEWAFLIDPHVHALNSSSRGRRRRALDHLAHRGLDRWATEAIVRCVADKEPSVRSAAVYALASAGPVEREEAARAVESALYDSNWRVRRVAVQSLSALGVGGSAIIECLRGDRHRLVRAEAAHALGSARRAEARIPLERSLEDDYWAVRGNAAEALVEVGGPASLDALARAEAVESNRVVRAVMAMAHETLAERVLDTRV